MSSENQAISRSNSSTNLCIAGCPEDVTIVMPEDTKKVVTAAPGRFEKTREAIGNLKNRAKEIFHDMPLPEKILLCVFSVVAFVQFSRLFKDFGEKASKSCDALAKIDAEVDTNPSSAPLPYNMTNDDLMRRNSIVTSAKRIDPSLEPLVYAWQSLDPDDYPSIVTAIDSIHVQVLALYEKGGLEGQRRNWAAGLVSQLSLHGTLARTAWRTGISLSNPEAGKSGTKEATIGANVRAAYYFFSFSKEMNAMKPALEHLATLYNSEPPLIPRLNFQKILVDLLHIACQRNQKSSLVYEPIAAVTVTVQTLDFDPYIGNLKNLILKTILDAKPKYVLDNYALELRDDEYWNACRVHPSLGNLVYAWRSIDPADHEGQVNALEKIQSHLFELFENGTVNSIASKVPAFADHIFSELTRERTALRTGINPSDKNMYIDGSTERAICLPTRQCYWMMNNEYPVASNDDFKNEFNHLVGLYTGTPQRINETTFLSIVRDLFNIASMRHQKPSLVYYAHGNVSIGVLDLTPWTDYMKDALQRLPNAQ